jgi:glycerol kinase
MIREKPASSLDAYFSGTKLQWILDHVPGARARARRGELAFGTIDSWLVWNLTGGRVHVTDVSNASRTMLFNMNPATGTTTSCGSSASRARGPAHRARLERSVRRLHALGRAIPIAGIAGDQQAALFGQACHATGMKQEHLRHRLLPADEHRPPPHRKHQRPPHDRRMAPRRPPPTYALEGSAFIAGAAVQWLRDGLGIIKTAAEVEPLARQSKTPTASTSSPPSPASAPPTGDPAPAESSMASREAPPPPTSPEPPSKASPTKTSTSSEPCKPTSASP